MRVIVLGAGLLGITSAYFLAKEGHEVTVIDRQPEPAMETSFANAGLISPGHANAWASPRAPMILLKSLWQEDASLRLRLKWDPSLWLWGLSFLKNCTTARNRQNTLVKLKLCLYSQGEIRKVSEAEGLSWDRISKGSVFVYQDAQHFAEGHETTRFIADQGVACRIMDVEETIALEPALAPARDKLVGGVHAPGDESGDARKFTLGLAEAARKLGVQFRMGESILSLESEGGRITRVVTDTGKSGRGEAKADQFVLALGSYAPLVARSAGIKLPVYPVKGYSLTLPLADPASAPTLGGVHEDYLVAFSRLGERLRLTATAEFAGYDTAIAPRHFSHMLRVARELFPKAAHYDRPDYWSCLRPMTPDGPPIMGASPIANLWLNCGHGHMGWSMATGSSRILVDQMLGRKPAIDDTPYLFSRY